MTCARGLAVASCMWLLVACVSSGKHEKLQKKYKDAQATIADRDQKVSSLEEEITKLKKQIKGLEGEKKALEDKVAKLEERKTELEGELTSVVKDKARLRESADKLKRAIAELQSRQALANARLAQLRVLVSRFKSLIDAGKLEIKIKDGRMVLVLPSDVLFASGKAKLNDDGVTSIVEVAKILSTFKDRQFQVEGHTDNVPIKTRKFPSNWDLAAARALTVVKTMVDAGVSPTILSAASYGEARPAASNASEGGRRQNRRIEIVLIPDLSTLPGFDELNKALKR